MFIYLKYIKILPERSDYMKINFKENCKSLFRSAIDNKALFERRKNSFIAPIVILLLAIVMMCVPNYLLSLGVKGSDLLKQFPHIESPLETLLTSSLDCKVVDGSFICDDNEQPLNVVVGDTIKYTVIVNQNTIAADTEVVYNTPKDTDNLIILLKNYIRIRYVERIYVEGEIKTHEIIGDYSNFEGFNLKEISTAISNNPELLSEETNTFIEKAYKSTLDIALYASFINSVVPFLIFILITSLMLKSPTLFKRKKGFTYLECMKISITSILPALLISTVSFLLLGTDVASILGIVYLIRIIFIYFKYLWSSNRNIYVELYNSTGEERFKLK